MIYAYIVDLIIIDMTKAILYFYHYPNNTLYKLEVYI